MTSPIHSCWNAEYTNIMTASNFETQRRTNSYYNSFESRELCFHYNDVEMCNYSNWNFCDVSENIYDSSSDEGFSYAEPKSHASLLLNGLNQKNDAEAIQERNFGNGWHTSQDTLHYPVVHKESSSSENSNYLEEYEYNFDSSR